MHEKVLSAATLEKAFKKTFNQVWLQRIHLQECKYTSASVQGASVSPWSKSCCQHKAYSSQIWFQHRFCYCINSLFVLNSIYSAPQLVFPLLSGENVHVWRCTWGIGPNLHVLHAWLKQMARVDPSVQPGKMLCLHLWLEVEREPFTSVSFQRPWLKRADRCHMDTKTCFHGPDVSF